MARAEVTLEIRKGPALRAALDVLDLVQEVEALVPEWHAEEKAELLARAAGLVETCARLLEER